MIFIIGGFGQDKLHRFETYLRSQIGESDEMRQESFPEKIIDGEEVLNRRRKDTSQATEWTTETLVREVQSAAPDGINHLHSLIRTLFLEDAYDRIREQGTEGSQNYLEAVEENLWRELHETFLNCKWILCDEVGNGVIPISGADRDYRMLVGRLQTRLAAEAESVYRMTCGIPTKIK